MLRQVVGGDPEQRAAERHERRAGGGGLDELAAIPGCLQLGIAVEVGLVGGHGSDRSLRRHRTRLTQRAELRLRYDASTVAPDESGAGRTPGTSAPEVSVFSGEARNAMVSRDLARLGPGRVVGLRHRRAVGRRVDDRRQHRVDQDALAEQLGGEALRDRRDARLRRRRTRSCRRPGTSTGRAATLTIRPPPPARADRRDRLAARQEAGDGVEPPLLLEVGERGLGDRRHREAADEVDRRPTARQRRVERARPAPRRRARRSALRRRARGRAHGDRWQLRARPSAGARSRHARAAQHDDTEAPVAPVTTTSCPRRYRSEDNHGRRLALERRRARALQALRQIRRRRSTRTRRSASSPAVRERTRTA